MFAVHTLDETLVTLDSISEAYTIAKTNSHDFGPLYVENLDTHAIATFVDGHMTHITALGHHSPACFGHSSRECPFETNDHV